MVDESSQLGAVQLPIEMGADQLGRMGHDNNSFSIFLPR
jgi:hypothetical protein